MLLLDVTPLSLGIETMGGVVAKIIPRNSTIPASAQEMFTTGVENQTGIDIHVLQGERELAKDCRSLARFHLKFRPARQASRASKLNSSSTPTASCKSPQRFAHRRQHSIEVQPSYGLNDTEIERMLEESIEYAEQDFAERQLIEARTESESILTATEKAFRDPRSSEISPAERRSIDDSVAALGSAIAGTDYKLIRKRIDELNQATTDLAEILMNSALQTALEGKRLDDV